MRLASRRSAPRSKRKTIRPAVRFNRTRRALFESLEARHLLANYINTSFGTASEYNPSSINTAYLSRDSDDSSDRLIVHWIALGEAVAGQDHTITEGTITIEAYDTAAHAIDFKVIDDTLAEGDETFYIGVTSTESFDSNNGYVPIEKVYTVVTTVGVIQDNDDGVTNGGSGPVGTGGGGSGHSGRDQPDPLLNGCTSCPPPPEKVNKASNAGAAETAPTSSGGPSGKSSNPVRYADGVAIIASTDLASDFNATPWGITRQWTNDDRYARLETFGNGMVIAEQPVLMVVEPGATQDDLPEELALITDGTTAYHFTLSGTAYVPLGFHKESLAYAAGSDQYVLTDMAGAAFRFYGFKTTTNSVNYGQIISYQDPGGNAINYSYSPWGQLVEMRRSISVGDQKFEESFLLKYNTYIENGDNRGLGRVQSVKLRRWQHDISEEEDAQTEWEIVREAAYTYYGASENYGNPFDLKLAQIKDGAGNILDTTYYRYYKDGESNGYEHGLRMVFNPDSYARLVAAFTNQAGIESQGNTAIDEFADNYFEYNSSQQVTLEIAQGAGCSCGGGQGTFTFSYSPNNLAGYTDAVNHWKTKTIEQLPDGNENIVFTNYLGEVILFVFHDKDTDGAGPDQDLGEWKTYYHYDAGGRVDKIASPAAVDAYSALSNDLGVDINDSQGLITEFAYYSTGATLGLLETSQIREGEAGSPLSMNYFAYTYREIDGHKIFLPTQTWTNVDGASTWYVNFYDYAYYTDSFQVKSVVVTDWAAGTSTVLYDTFGRPTWTKDQSGYINYLEYDRESGEVSKAIIDVDTDEVTTFNGLPSGWTTPEGNGGFHLTTEYERDELGRPTMIKGNRPAHPFLARGVGCGGMDDSLAAEGGPWDAWRTRRWRRLGSGGWPGSGGAVCRSQSFAIRRESRRLRFMPGGGACVGQILRGRGRLCSCPSSCRPRSQRAVSASNCPAELS